MNRDQRNRLNPEKADLPALLDYATLITRTPDRATPEAIATLMAAGLAPRDVVMLGQLIAHVNMQARLLAGLRLLEEAA